MDHSSCQSLGGPSSNAKPKEFHKKQQNNQTIYNGRLFECTGHQLLSIMTSLASLFKSWVMKDCWSLQLDREFYVHSIRIEEDCLNVIEDELAALLGPMGSDNYGSRRNTTLVLDSVNRN